MCRLVSCLNLPWGFSDYPVHCLLIREIIFIFCIFLNSIKLLMNYYLYLSGLSKIFFETKKRIIFSKILNFVYLGTKIENSKLLMICYRASAYYFTMSWLIYFLSCFWKTRASESILDINLISIYIYLNISPRLCVYVLRPHWIDC